MIESGKLPVAALTSLAMLLLAGSGFAYADNIRIGLAAPLTGTFAPLGNQLAQGARAAADAKSADLVIFDDRCDAEGGKQAAERFIAQNVRIASGFLCRSAGSGSTRSGRAQHSSYRVGCQRTNTGRASRRVALAGVPLEHGTEKETQATASFLGSLWRAQPFAVIDDGTIEGRERASRVLAS